MTAMRVIDGIFGICGIAALVLLNYWMYPPNAPLQPKLRVLVLAFVALFVWPLIRAIWRRSGPHILLGASAVIGAASPFLMSRPLAMSTLNDALSMSAPAFLYALMPVRPPRFVVVLGVVECLLVVVLSSTGSTDPFHSITEYAAIACIVPSAVWYVVNRDEIWYEQGRPRSIDGESA